MHFQVEWLCRLNSHSFRESSSLGYKWAWTPRLSRAAGTSFRAHLDRQEMHSLCVSLPAALPSMRSHTDQKQRESLQNKITKVHRSSFSFPPHEAGAHEGDTPLSSHQVLRVAVRRSRHPRPPPEPLQLLVSAARGRPQPLEEAVRQQPQVRQVRMSPEGEVVRRHGRYRREFPLVTVMTGGGGENEEHFESSDDSSVVITIVIKVQCEKEFRKRAWDRSGELRNEMSIWSALALLSGSLTEARCGVLWAPPSVGRSGGGEHVRTHVTKQAIEL